MGQPKTYRIREILRPYRLAMRIGLLTAAVILLFEMVNTLVIYRYMKLDYYLCIVAVFFLLVGLLVSRRKSEVPAGKQEMANPAKVMELLSAKEWQILGLLAQGLTNKEIAAAQFVELSTVKTHLNNIYSKLSVTNRKEARVKYTELAPQWRIIT